MSPVWYRYYNLCCCRVEVRLGWMLAAAIVVSPTRLVVAIGPLSIEVAA